MSNKLTKKQLDVIPKYRDAWTKIAFEFGKPLPSLETIKEAFNEAYIGRGLKAPKDFYIAKSPFDLANIVNRLRVEKYNQEPQREDRILFEAHNGNQDSAWFGFYDFCIREGKIEECKPLEKLINLAKNGLGWFYTTEEEVIVSPIPTYLKLQNNQLHCTTGPAIHYAEDNTSLYFMYGIQFYGDRIKFATTPADELKVQDVLDIENVEERSAVIKKVGFEKFINYLNPKILETKEFAVNRGGKYMLYSIEMPNGSVRKYLKMENPSVSGDYPFEAVPPEVETVQQALAYRTFGDYKAKFVLPDVLT